MKKERIKKIALVGGGTAGPVVPLLAVVEVLRLRNEQVGFVFVGTSSGPEKAMAEKAGIEFFDIPAGKLRRYFSLSNFLSPVLVLLGFLKSLWLVYKLKPDVAVGASGFVQVPFLWACFLMRVPVVIHQQDVLPSLANTLCAVIATRITTAFESSVRDFSQGLGIYKEKSFSKVVWTGNPVRQSILGVGSEAARKNLGIDLKMPTLLVFGGGTGALGVNELVYDSLDELTKFCQVVHVTGAGRGNGLVKHKNYYQFDFISDMASAYASSDVVVSRAGIGTISELAFLGKVAIIIPMPNSHQEDNAALLWGKKAAMILDEKETEKKEFVHTVRKLFIDQNQRALLSKNIKSLMPEKASDKVAEIILDVVF
jgi:UDP-N-acetylglucosamine--N-acetylmuramyl-(pentapeptide) pyrophosphoryl-undecaprenol N-acetylglucosamine transferase